MFPLRKNEKRETWCRNQTCSRKIIARAIASTIKIWSQTWKRKGVLGQRNRQPIIQILRKLRAVSVDAIKDWEAWKIC